MAYERFDPYQIFEVEHRPCLIFTVKVLCGRNITKGSWSDLVDTPDPYIKLSIKTAPEGRKYTTVKDNDVNPVWNESFEFLLDNERDNIMEISLMDSNYLSDEIVEIVYFKVKEIPLDTTVKKTFLFNEVSEVDIEMHVSFDVNPTLRYSLCLCQEEKEFLAKKKEKARDAMKKLLGIQGPFVAEDTPTIAVIGSGGGFRAMVGFSGVAKALHDTGLLDCTTYISGLSGSSWYISTLYSHPDFPHKSPGDLQEDLKNNVDSSLLWLLTPQSVYRYMDRIMKKRQMGQPVSFTDIFGHMVGETLLRDRQESRLSDQQGKLTHADIPLPLLTCVHVKEDRSARSFQEWVEFSPYEIGMAKYGTFMKTELFGSKFFMGRLCKEYEEPPLHFLQGIWGSAFCILFKRLMDDNKNMDPTEMMRQEMAKQVVANHHHLSSDSSDEGDIDEGDEEESSAPSSVDAATPRKPMVKKSKRRTKKKGFWQNVLVDVFENKNCDLLTTRAGRAGAIHNFMRGLHLHATTAFPLAPFSPQNMPDKPKLDNTDSRKRRSHDFEGMYEMQSTKVHHLYMVDAGLTFNSPFPLVLRPQRGVDIILSFDFSARHSDSSPPFNELLLAAKWAKKQGVPFPPIDTTVFDREGMKEMYIFKDPKDPHCPIVLHFSLVNVEFRDFSKPGVRRETKEEKEFGDFDIFDDPLGAYSTFNFKYSHHAFDRLAQLMEFNTLLNVDRIKEVIAERIATMKSTPETPPIMLEDIPKLRRVSVRNRKRLSKFVSHRQSGQSRVSVAELDLEIAMEKGKIEEETSSGLAEQPSAE